VKLVEPVHAAPPFWENIITQILHYCQ
jgi:hypothetical protein